MNSSSDSKEKKQWLDIILIFLSSYLVFFISGKVCSGKPNLSLEKKYVEGRRRRFLGEIAQH